MPLLPNNHGRAAVRLIALALSLGVALMAPAQVVNPAKESPPKPPDPKNGPVEGFATWYEVPKNSRTKQRAAKDELTAAHNRLPVGTKVRVTHLKNQKNVVVRITDRVVSKRRTHIDLCKEAAEKLDMIREGSTRVRLEILPEGSAPESKPKRWWERLY